MYPISVLPVWLQHMRGLFQSPIPWKECGLRSWATPDARVAAVDRGLAIVRGHLLPSLSRFFHGPSANEITGTLTISESGPECVTSRTRAIDKPHRQLYSSID